MAADEAATTIGSTSEVLEGAGRYLLVSAGGALRAFALPEAGEVVVGREAGCQVVIDHARVSRQHVRLRVGAVCSIEDLGSRNGTSLRGRALAPNTRYELRPGESFNIGPITLVLLPPGARAPITPAGGGPLRVEDPTAAEAPPALVAIARAPISVILRGETGVGKHVLAERLHALSGRAGALVPVRCAALGADDPAGWLEAAAGGTLLLDDVGHLPPPLQAKVLGAVGSAELRVLATTQDDLLAAPGFPRDLYYRLAGVTLGIPPLRERRHRIAAIALDLLAGQRALSPAALARLEQHDWPGNVRELRNVLERAALLAGGGELRPEHIVLDRAEAPVAPAAEPEGERARIIAALAANAGNQTRAARQLGISRATFVNKLALLDIPRPRPRRR